MSQPLFGLVPAGQSVIVTPTSTPTPTSFLYAVSSLGKPSTHIVVFLLPGIELPEGTAAAIYLVTPAGPGQTEPNSKFLGGIGPGKDSAIFKVGSNGQENIVIGVSVEDASSVLSRLADQSRESEDAKSAALTLMSVAQKQQPSTLVLAQRIIENAFNFLASFSGTAGPNQVEVVPLKAFEDWWRKFEGRIRSDPGFLERNG